MKKTNLWLENCQCLNLKVRVDHAWNDLLHPEFQLFPSTFPKPTNPSSSPRRALGYHFPVSIFYMPSVFHTHHYYHIIAALLLVLTSQAENRKLFTLAAKQQTTPVPLPCQFRCILPRQAAKLP